MDKSSFFIEGKCLFGGFPATSDIQELEDHGVVCFVNLTSNEDLPSYECNVKYIHFPIKDQKIPEDKTEFCKFIMELCDIIDTLNRGKKMYLHCKGGHGRSGVVVASILCHKFKLDPIKALELTTRYHNARSHMKDKWRAVGSPQTMNQKLFVFSLFKPFYFSEVKISDFSNVSLYNIQIDNKEFETADEAYKAIKQCDDDIDSMKRVLKCKFDQHENLKNSLIAQCLRPLIYVGKDSYWTNDTNNLGKLLVELRDEYIFHK